MRIAAIRRAFWGVATLLLMAGALGGTVAAGPLACDTTTNNTFSGRVTKVGAALTVRATDDKDRTVTAGPGLVVVRNGANGAFGDVREGDQVNVTVPAGSADCTATRIEAASTATAANNDNDNGRPWGLLGLLGLLGLAGLLRRPQPQVHTTRTVLEPREPVVTEPRERTVVESEERTNLQSGERIVVRSGEPTRREQ